MKKTGQERAEKMSTDSKCGLQKTCISRQATYWSCEKKTTTKSDVLGDRQEHIWNDIATQGEVRYSGIGTSHFDKTWMSTGFRGVQNVSCDVYRWDLREASLHLPNHWGNPVLQIPINVEHKTVSCARVRRNREGGFVLYKALTQTSSWVSCDSNPFICSPSLCMKHLPNMLIYPHMPTYSTVLDCDFQSKDPWFSLKCLWYEKHFLTYTHILLSLAQMHKHTRLIFAHTSKFPHM